MRSRGTWAVERSGIRCAGLVRALRRRGPEATDDLGTFWKLVDRWICRCARILHPYPAERFDASIQGRSRMREYRTYGSVRGAPGNRRPYRDDDIVRLSIQPNDAHLSKARPRWWRAG